MLAYNAKKEWTRRKNDKKKGHHENSSTICWLGNRHNCLAINNYDTYVMQEKSAKTKSSRI